MRTLMIDDKIWFVGEDICRILEYTNTSKTLNDHVREKYKIHTRDVKLNNESLLSLDLGQRGSWLINESGLYSLILKSKMGKAEVFQDWVLEEVLPSIRKTGIYAKDNLLDNPEMLLEIVTKLVEERREHNKTKSELNIKSIQLDESKDWYSVKRVAILNNISWKSINWRKLKNTSEYMQYEINKIFDANYGNVNAYHIDIWMQEYPELKYE